MPRPAHQEAAEAAERLDTIAKNSAEHAATLEHAAALIRDMSGANGKRLTVEALATALHTAWPNALPETLPPGDGMDAFKPLARAVLDALQPPKVEEGLRLNYRQIAYLKDLASGCGIKRGESHPNMAALARHGLARYERRHWWITDAGRQWLESHLPDFVLPPL